MVKQIDVTTMSDLALMVEGGKISKQQEMCGDDVSDEITENLKNRFTEILIELNLRNIYKKIPYLNIKFDKL